MKRIAIIGATGSTGKEVTDILLKRGHMVNIVARRPSFIEPRPNLTILPGDVRNIESLQEAFKDVDAVISCFGPTNARRPGKLMSEGTLNIVHACERNGVRRLVFMSGILQSPGSELTFFNRMAIKFVRLFFNEVYRDKIIAERSIQESELNWVIIRAVGLGKSEPLGKYKAGVLASVSPFNPLPFRDLALCLVDSIDQDTWTKKIINAGKT